MSDQFEAARARQTFREQIIRELNKPNLDMEWIKQLLSAEACAAARFAMFDAPPPESPSEEDGEDDSPEDVIGQAAVQ
jgi:hypothetical protein